MPLVTGGILERVLNPSSGIYPWRMRQFFFLQAWSTLERAYSAFWWVFRGPAPASQLQDREQRHVGMRFRDSLCATKGVIQAKGQVAVGAVLEPTEVADGIVHMASLPLPTNLQFLMIMATRMLFVRQGSTA